MAFVVLAALLLVWGMLGLAIGGYLAAVPDGRWTAWFRTVDLDEATNAELAAEHGLDYLLNSAILVLAGRRTLFCRAAGWSSPQNRKRKMRHAICPHYHRSCSLHG